MVTITVLIYTIHVRGDSAAAGAAYTDGVELACDDDNKRITVRVVRHMTIVNSMMCVCVC